MGPLCIQLFLVAREITKKKFLIIHHDNHTPSICLVFRNGPDSNSDNT